MKKLQIGFSTGVPLPKINYKKQKAKLKRDLRKKDREFQSIPEDAICVVALNGKIIDQCVGDIVKHHIIRRRNMELRHKEENTLLLCTGHHGILHGGGEKTFAKKYNLQHLYE